MSLAGRLINQLVKTGRRVIPQPRFAPASALDTITNPKTYIQLADDATDALGQLLPQQFRGAGFQNVPTKALGALDDLRDLPAGPIKEMAQRKAAQQFTKAAGSGTQRIPVIPTGGQQVIPGSVKMLADDIVTAGSTTLKRPGLLNSVVGGAKRFPYVGAALAVGEGLLDGRDPIDAVARGAFGVTGSALGAMGYGALGLPSGPGALGTALFGGGLGYEGGTQFYDNVAKPAFVDYLKDPGVFGGGMPGADVLSAPINTGRSSSLANLGRNYKEEELLAAQKADLSRPLQPVEIPEVKLDKKPKKKEVGPTPDYTLDPVPRVQPPGPTDPPSTPTVIPGTPIPQTPSVAARPYAPADQSGNVGATYANGTSTMPNANAANTVLPPNAEQILQANPMDIYAQARVASLGQDQAAANKVRDLGLAIHRQQFPNLYKTDNTMPGAMTAKDDANALDDVVQGQLDDAMLSVFSGGQPLLDPNKFLQLQLSGRVAR